MKRIIIILILVTAISNLYSKSGASLQELPEPRYIVNMPTAGVLAEHKLSVYGLLFSSGGFLLKFDITPYKNVNIGISYSGINILGEGKIIMQKLPGFEIRWRFLDETKFLPALLAGVGSQGRGKYYKQFSRFQNMSPGVFAAASKSFNWYLGYFALHGGINYSWEQAGGQYVPNFWFGLEHSLGRRLSLHLEFNPNLADTKSNVMSNSMLLNTQIRWLAAEGVILDFVMYDLFNHTKNPSGFERWLGMEFIHNF